MSWPPLLQLSQGQQIFKSLHRVSLEVWFSFLAKCMEAKKDEWFNDVVVSIFCVCFLYCWTSPHGCLVKWPAIQGCNYSWRLLNMHLCQHVKLRIQMEEGGSQSRKKQKKNRVHLAFGDSNFTCIHYLLPPLHPHTFTLFGTFMQEPKGVNV